MTHPTSSSTRKINGDNEHLLARIPEDERQAARDGWQHLEDFGGSARHRFRGNTLIAAFVRLIPNWKKEFVADGPIEDNAVVQRADKGRRIGYEKEWPDRNEKSKPYWKQAKQDVASGKRTFQFAARGKAKKRAAAA